MLHALARNWWMLLVRGIAAVIFGLLALFTPLAAGAALVILFGAYAFVDGIFALFAAIRAVEAKERWLPLLIEGIVGLVIAAITFYDLTLTALALYFTIAAWAFITGVLEVVAAVRLRKLMEHAWLLVLGGICSIAFGGLMVLFPELGVTTVIYLIGAYAVLFGVLMISFSLRLRAHAGHGTA
jgi:uncharacterized membrane protein HdeD (DUF308 family)